MSYSQGMCGGVSGENQANETVISYADMFKNKVEESCGFIVML